MRQILYAMQFTGEGAPAADGVLHAATSAPSTRIVSRVGSSGLETTIDEVDGRSATFTSDVRMTGDSSFEETGTITFGDGDSLDFSTIGEGYMGSSPEDGLSHGSVMWRIDRGTGRFEGATGIITSNFTFSSKGEVTDHHFGVIWVP